MLGLQAPLKETNLITIGELDESKSKTLLEY
jgi:hypothetical protein